MPLLCIWMYLLVTWSFGWALAGKFFLTEIVFLFHNRRSLTLLGKDSWGLVSLILPIITVTGSLSKHSFNTNDILYRVHFFPEIFKLFSKCSGNFDIDLMVVVSGPWGENAVWPSLIFLLTSCSCYLNFSGYFLCKDGVASCPQKLALILTREHNYIYFIWHIYTNKWSKFLCAGDK